MIKTIKSVRNDYHGIQCKLYLQFAFSGTLVRRTVYDERIHCIYSMDTEYLNYNISELQHI